MIKVTLNEEEGRRAFVIAGSQMMAVSTDGRLGRDHGGSSGRDMATRYGHNIQGIVGEIAFCKAFGIYYTETVEEELGIQIRSSEFYTGHLIIYECDFERYEGVPFVLTVGSWPNINVTGWIKTPSFAKRDEWYRDGPKDPKPYGYWVPQKHLIPINELDLNTKRAILKENQRDFSDAPEIPRGFLER